VAEKLREGLGLGDKIMAHTHNGRTRYTNDDGSLRLPQVMRALSLLDNPSIILSIKNIKIA